MEIRKLRPDDFAERMALSQYAFQVKFTEEQLEARRAIYPFDQDWGTFDEQGRLQSALLLLNLSAWVHGREMGMGGIAGVATWPEARRQGGVSKLLAHALETMRNNGQPISMLHPFAFAFYRKFGYELTIERKKYTIETHQLPPRQTVPGHVERLAKPDAGVLGSIYSAYASRYNGNVVRTPEWWAERVLKKEGTIAVYFNEKGAPEGYLFYEVSGRTMTVHEWVDLNETARTALWSFIGNHDSMIREVTLTAPIDDELPFLLADPRIKQEIVPYFMSRIVDAEAFVSQYAWAKGPDGESVALKLEDAHASWNNGTFRLVWGSEGEGRLERVEDRAVDAAEAISCDIQTLAAMLLGDKKPTWLASAGRLQASSEKSLLALERRIPERTAYLMDFF